MEGRIGYCLDVYMSCCKTLCISVDQQFFMVDPLEALVKVGSDKRILLL